MDTYSPQAAVLGSLLISPELTGEVLTKVGPQDFLDPTCRRVFEAIRALFSAGKPIDPVTVRDKLGPPEGEDWSKALMYYMDVTPTAVNIWEYVPMLKSQARMAATRQLGEALANAPDEETAGKLIDRLNGLRGQRQGAERMDMEQLLLDFYDRHTHPHTYLTWGLENLDRNLYAELGDMVVIGGDPSTGKTALSVGFAWHLAQTYRVGFYSLETNRHKLADRLVANLAGIELGSIKRGKLTEADWSRVTQRAEEVRKRSLELIEASGMTMADIRADTLAHRYQVIFIDYLQIVSPDNRRDNRTNQVGQISRDIQSLAHGCGITVVALSQLSRRENGDEPIMSDLRESGQIEQDADIVMLLYLEDPRQPGKSRRVLKIGKNKDGERGKNYLVFDGAYQRFRASQLDCPAPADKPKRRRKPPQTSLFDWDDRPPVPDPFEQPTGAQEA